MADDFLDKLADRSLPVAVVGLGYVGLPLAVTLAEGGLPTIGFDLDAEKCSHLMLGRSHIEDVADARVAAVVDAGRMRAVADPAALRDVEAVFICVPTPFDRAKSPDLSYVKSAAGAVAAALHHGMLVVLQSTTFPGTTSDVVQPILEAGGLRAGVDFHLAFSPERVDPGNAIWTVGNTPKVVGGVTARCAALTAALFEAVMDQPGLVRVLSSPGAAEMTKLLENTYRAVNIALVNELAQLAHEMGLDIWEIIDAAATKPFGFQAFYPGIGPGGHCIPVDPYYLSWRAREFDFQTKFIELAADTNLRMANYVADRVQRFLNRHGRTLSGTSILALGVAFKAGVSDVRNSRALRLIELLQEQGAEVRYADPFVATVTIGGVEHKADDLTPDRLSDVDLVLGLVNHQGWPVDLILHSKVLFFDPANILRSRTGPSIERL